MKKILFLSLTFLLLFALAGCSGKPYSFKESVEEIVNIEFVAAENYDYVVIKTLSEEEKEDFLEQFQKIVFKSRLPIGDLSRVGGDAVKITYSSGNYEMICYYCAEYVKTNGRISIIEKYCDTEDFNELVDYFLE